MAEKGEDKLIKVNTKTHLTVLLIIQLALYPLDNEELISIFIVFAAAFVFFCADTDGWTIASFIMSLAYAALIGTDYIMRDAPYPYFSILWEFCWAYVLLRTAALAIAYLWQRAKAKRNPAPITETAA